MTDKDPGAGAAMAASADEKPRADGGQDELIRMAVEDVPFGSPVREMGDGCGISLLLTDMIGVARRRRGDDGRGYSTGEDVFIRRDGGVLARIAEDVDITVRGVICRLRAGDQPYLHLAGGKIVGYQGDGVAS